MCDVRPWSASNWVGRSAGPDRRLEGRSGSGRVGRSGRSDRWPEDWSGSGRRRLVGSVRPSVKGSVRCTAGRKISGSGKKIQMVAFDEIIWPLESTGRGSSTACDYEHRAQMSF